MSARTHRPRNHEILIRRKHEKEGRARARRLAAVAVAVLAVLDIARPTVLDAQASRTKPHVVALASERLEGRLAGSNGERLASDYLAGVLQKMGAKVTLIDTWGPGNSRSTSGEETRGVRSSYGDRPHGELWAKWATQAIKRWKEWDEEHHRTLQAKVFYTTGDLIFRKDWEPYMKDTRKNWDTLGIKYEVLTPNDVSLRK